MEPSKSFAGRYFSPSTEVGASTCWNNSNHDTIGLIDFQYDANQMVLNPLLHKRMYPASSERDFPHNSNVLPFVKLEADTTNVNSVYSNPSNIYPDHVYGSISSSLPTNAIPIPSLRDRDYKIRPHEWKAPISSTPVHEYAKNSAYMAMAYAPRISTSDSLCQNASPPPTPRQQQQQQQQQQQKRSPNECSSLRYEFASDNNEEQPVKDQSFQFLDEILMDQSLETPDTSREQLAANTDDPASNFPLHNADSVAYGNQDEDILAEGNFKYQIAGLSAEHNHLKCEDLNNSNNTNNMHETSYNSYYSHTSDSTGNMDATESNGFSTTGTTVKNFHSSFEATCREPTTSVMHQTSLYATPLPCSSAGLFSTDEQLRDDYPNRSCTQTWDRCSQSFRQPCQTSMPFQQANTTNMTCACGNSGSHPPQILMSYSCSNNKPIKHLSGEAHRRYGSSYSTDCQETIAELFTARTNEICQNYNMPGGDAQILSSSQAQTHSTNNYFWQYNAQCKGPKAIRLIEFDNTAMSGSQISGELDDLSGSQEPSYFSSNEPLTSSYGDSCPIEEKDFKLPKLLANSSVSPYSLPNYPLVIFEDPVQRRYDLVHCSKLRRGDGNDVTPNLARLRSMGEELECLNEQLLEHGEIIVSGAMSPQSTNDSNSMVVLSPTGGLVKRSNVGNCANSTVAAVLSGCKLVEQAKREKNKLASKICRLKKKAFHEANKIKYTGLELEYSELAAVIVHVKRLISEHLQRTNQLVVRNAVKSSYSTSTDPQHVQQQQQQQPDQETSEYLVSSTTGMDEYHLTRRCANPPAGVTATQQSRGNRLEAYTFEPMYCSTSRSTYSLFEQASHMYSTLHVTHAAGRTDALVEEVLRMAREGLNTHPLIKQMAADGLGGQLGPSVGCASFSAGTKTFPGYVQVVAEAPITSHTPTQSVRTQSQPTLVATSPTSTLSNNYATINPPPKFVVPYNPLDARSIRHTMLHY